MIHRSNITQWIYTYPDISGSDPGCQTNIIFLDFVKAFDSVPHNPIVRKLKKLALVVIAHNYLYCLFCFRRENCAFIQILFAQHGMLHKLPLRKAFDTRCSCFN